MHAPFIEIAISKAASPAQRDMLGSMLPLAVRLDTVEAGFEAKINASKASRGEGPTKLSKSEREELEALAQDERELENEQLEECRALPRATQVIAVLHAGMESDLPFWEQTVHQVHPSDARVIRELVEAKTELFESMARFLGVYPESEE